MDTWIIAILDVDDLEEVFVFRREEAALSKFEALRREVEEGMIEIVPEGNLDSAGETDQYFHTDDGCSYHLRRVWAR